MEINKASVIVTGAGRGIGRFLADDLLQKAARVTIAEKNQDLLKDIPQQANLASYGLDVTDRVAVEKAMQEMVHVHGANVLINNAGLIHSEPLFNLLSKEDKKHSLENWKRVIDVNLTSVFNVTSCFAEQMIAAKREGVIINISSISAGGNIGQSAYSAAKAGVEALTTTWSKELGMFKIRCACIAPGFFDTPSTRESLNDHMLKKWEKSVPLGRLGQLKELSSAVEFIISNDYYNGKVLQLDGGLTL